MKEKVTISTMLLLALFLTLPSTILASTRWYVNGVTGSDTNNCLSSATVCGYRLLDESERGGFVTEKALRCAMLLGAKAAASTRNNLLTICKEMNIAVCQMRMSNDKYELIADPPLA